MLYSTLVQRQNNFIQNSDDYANTGSKSEHYAAHDWGLQSVAKKFDEKKTSS